MQLEFDFEGNNLEKTAIDFFDNCYSMLIWMHIIAA